MSITPVATNSSTPIQNATHPGRYFETLLAHLPVAAYTCDIEGLILYFNPEAERLWGRAPKIEDPVDRYCGSFELFATDGTSLPHDQCWMAKALMEETGYNGCGAVIRRSDGTDVHVLAHANPIHDDAGHLIGAVNVLVDLSEQKMAEEIIQQITNALAPKVGQHFFCRLANDLCRECHVEYAFIGALEPNTTETARSIAMSRRGETIDNFVYGYRDTPCGEVIAQCFRYYPDNLQVKFPKALPIQEMGIHSYMGLPLFSSQGKPLGLIALLGTQPIDKPERAEAILRVIAARAAAELEREQAEKDLRTSEARYAGLVNNIDGIVWEADAASQRYRFVSQQAERILGYTPDRWLDEPDFWTEHLHPEDRDRVIAERLGRVQQAVDYAMEYRLLDAEGRIVWIHDLVSVETLDGQAITLRGVSVDISERKQAEAERQQLERHLRQTQKLESLGVLAGGIAHDFNNLLTSVLGNASLALMHLSPDSPAHSMVREIEKAAERSADLTRQMLSYSGRGELVARPLRLDWLAQEMTTLLNSVVAKNTTLDLDLRSVTVDGDSSQLQQVVMNLITNASEALDGQAGTVEIRTGFGPQSAESLRSRFLPEALPAGVYAFVEVEDSGSGMAEETLTRIFDPFFTTKFTGRGLGLAATLGIVRSHGGTITVTTALGKGTLVRVLLPISQEIATASGGEPEPTTPWSEIQGTILVVDDEPAVCELARRTLEAGGLRVLIARDGAKGLDVLEAHQAEISAVLLDLTMPHLDGTEMLQRLRQRWPHLPVVLMSGYCEHKLVKACDGLGVERLLYKPFRPTDLMAQLQRCLTPSDRRERSAKTVSTRRARGPFPQSAD